MCIASLIHRSILLLSLSISMARTQSMTWLREIAWSPTADLICSVAADLLLLRAYALTSRCVTSCRCSCSSTPKALPVPPKYTGLYVLSSYRPITWHGHRIFSRWGCRENLWLLTVCHRDTCRQSFQWRQSGCRNVNNNNVYKGCNLMNLSTY